MPSVFDQKIAAVRDKIPQSVLDSPWKRTLLLAVFLVGAITTILFFAIFGLLKVIFDSSNRSSHSSTPLVDEDQQNQAGVEDIVFIHQHYKMNEFGTIQGLKDPEW